MADLVVVVDEQGQLISVTYAPTTDFQKTIGDAARAGDQSRGARDGRVYDQSEIFIISTLRDAIDKQPNLSEAQRQLFRDEFAKLRPGDKIVATFPNMVVQAIFDIAGKRSYETVSRFVDP